MNSKLLDIALIPREGKAPFVLTELLAERVCLFPRHEQERDPALMFTSGGNSERWQPLGTPPPLRPPELPKNKRQFTLQNITSVTVAPNY